MTRFRTTIHLTAALLVIAIGSDTAAQPAMSNRCFTPQFWCWLPGPAPVGASCYCPTPYGAVNGVVR